MIYYMGYYNNNATGDRKGTAPKKEIGKKTIEVARFKILSAQDKTMINFISIFRRGLIELKLIVSFIYFRSLFQQQK